MGRGKRSWLFAHTYPDYRACTGLWWRYCGSLFLLEDDEAREKRKQTALEVIDGGAQLVSAAITLVGAADKEYGLWFVFVGHRHSWIEDRIRYTRGYKI